MDPFAEVLHDAQQQAQSLKEFLSKLTAQSITEESKSDFNNNIQELNETIEDLKESIQSSKNDPDFFKITKTEISKREEIVDKLVITYNDLLKEWTAKQSSAVKTTDGSNPFVRYDEQQPGVTDAYQQFQQQQLLQEQDQHLDGVYNSMQTIHQQAREMGNELEEQAYIIDEIEGDLDRIGNKVGRGLRRVEHVIRANQETASNCCIGLLIVALIVLLVMVIIV